jgi:hypothetical protein
MIVWYARIICHAGLQTVTTDIFSYMIYRNYWKLYHCQRTNVVWEPSNARQRLVKHVPIVTKLFTLQRQQYCRVANILVTQDINNEERRFLCNRNKVI